MSDVLLLARAWHFAAERHVHQKRKGEAKEPYVNHLAEVAELVAQASGGRDANLVAAAVLHDTIEDTGVSKAELAAIFNADVADLVAEVTDDKGLPKAKRKQLQVETAAKKSPRAKILKLADKISNLRSLANSPPVEWDIARRRDYVAWAEQVVAGLGSVDPWLEARFEEAVKDVRGLLGMAES